MLTSVLSTSLCFSLQSTPAPVPPAPAAAEVRTLSLPSSPLQIRLAISGFTTEDRHAQIMKNLLGDRVLLAGAFPAWQAALEVIADREPVADQTDEKARAFNLDPINSWKLFDAGGMACGEQSVRMDGTGSHDLHAFAVRGGFNFDIHLGEALTGREPAVVGREDFARILDSVRFAVVRRGTWDQMPAATLELMNTALGETDWKSWLEAHIKSHPEENEARFAMAELLRYHDAKPAEQIAAYEKTIELLTAKTAPTHFETLARAASEEGRGLALLDSGEPEKAIPHMEKGLEIACDLTGPIRAGICYSLARAHARLGQVELAIGRLRDSEGNAPGAVLRSRTDPDFEKVSKSKQFQETFFGKRPSR